MHIGLRRALVVLAGMALAGTGLAVPAGPASAAPVVPAQFIAKLYSEALGRIPDAGGWTGNVNFFASAGCNANTVRDRVRAFYNSPEFLGRPYDSAARVLTIYRGALNREPDQGGLNAYTAQLQNASLTWSQVVESFAQSGELTGLAQQICNAASTSYYYGTQPAPDLPVSGGGFAGGTGQQLQAALNSTPGGGTVFLAQKAVVRLTAPLVIPRGVTLATTGTPGPGSYALQGRLVRSSMFDAAMVQVEGGGRLDSVWVDGQRGDFHTFAGSAINVLTLGGSGTEVRNSKLSNSASWSTLQALGSAEGRPCGGTTVAGNLVTAYSSEHFPLAGARWTDGLSIACENARIQNNSVIDATDVGIVLFRATPANQASVVSGNQILSAGNSAYGAMAVDGLLDAGGTPGFVGASVSGNAFWTGPRTHFDIGLAVGTRPWFGTRSDAGTGVTVNNNTTNGLTAVVGTGIAVSGMFNATVQGNGLQLVVSNVSNCPHVNIGVDADGYAAGSNIQAGGTAVHFWNPANGAGCIGH
jgi:hypothetical protein